MAIKPRSQGQTAISVSMPQDLLAEIDARAASLNLNRSQYLAQLARADVSTGGAMVIQENANSVVRPETTGKVVKVLKSYGKLNRPAK